MYHGSRSLALSTLGPCSTRRCRADAVAKPSGLPPVVPSTSLAVIAQAYCFDCITLSFHSVFYVLHLAKIPVGIWSTVLLHSVRGMIPRYGIGCQLLRSLSCAPASVDSPQASQVPRWTHLGRTRSVSASDVGPETIPLGTGRAKGLGRVLTVAESRDSLLAALMAGFRRAIERDGLPSFANGTRACFYRRSSLLS